MNNDEICQKHNQTYQLSCDDCDQEKKQLLQEVLNDSHNFISLLYKFQEKVHQKKQIGMNTRDTIMYNIRIFTMEIHSEKQRLLLQLNSQNLQNYDQRILEKLQKLNERIRKWLDDQLKITKIGLIFTTLTPQINLINCDISQSLKFLKISIQKEIEQCLSFAFNKNNSILFVGYQSGKIKLFMNKSQLRLINKLKIHQGQVNKLVWMKNSNFLLSVGEEQSIITWKNQLPLQILQRGQIYSIILNEQEDILITGEKSGIQFWQRNIDIWTYQQTVFTNNVIQNFNLNPQQTKLIAIG